MDRTARSGQQNMRVLAQAPVRCIAFAPRGPYAASTAQGERHVVLWHLAAPREKKPDGKKKKVAAAGLLSADEPVHSLCLGPAEGSASFQVTPAAACGPLHATCTGKAVSCGLLAWELPAQSSEGACKAAPSPDP